MKTRDSIKLLALLSLTLNLFGNILCAKDTSKVFQQFTMLNKEAEDTSVLDKGRMTIKAEFNKKPYYCEGKVNQGQTRFECGEIAYPVKAMPFEVKRDFKFSGWYNGKMKYELDFPNIKSPDGYQRKKGWILIPKTKTDKISEKYKQTLQTGDHTFMHEQSINHKVLYYFKDDEAYLALPSKWDRKIDREIRINGKYISNYPDGGIKIENQYYIHKYIEITNNSIKEHTNADFDILLKGTFAKYYENGNKYFQIKYEEHYMKNVTDDAANSANELYGDGKLTGYYTAWHENGQLLCEGKLKNGKRHGKWKYYDFDGKIEEQAKYSHGKLTGKYIAYYDNGKKRRKVNFYNNLKSGLLMEWFQSGKVKHKAEYYKGTLHGLYQDYNQYGNMTLSGIYNEGLKTDQWEYFYRNGKLKIREQYMKNLRNGIRETYYPNEQIKSRINFSKGKEKGMFKSWYKNGQTLATGKYHLGIKTGSWKHWNIKGGLIEIINYALIKNDQDSIKSRWFTKHHFENEKSLRNGDWIQYHPNGKKKLESVFKDGILYGIQKHYDTSEVIIEEITFKNGEKTGPYRKYYPNGALMIDGEYTDPVTLKTNSYFYSDSTQAIKNGNGIVIEKNGTLKEQTSYVNGIPHGKWINWYSNGQIKEQGTYDNGKENGPYKLYNKRGELIEEGILANGLETGEWNYYKGGKLFERGIMIDGERFGIWTTFYENGKMKSEIEIREDRREIIHNLFDSSGKQLIKNGQGYCKLKNENGFLIEGQIKNGLKEGEWKIVGDGKTKYFYSFQYKEGVKIK